MSNEIALSRPIRSTLSKSLSKLNPAESIAKLKDAGRKVRERLQRPTLERTYDPDPLFQDSESDAQDISTQTRTPILVAGPRASLSQAQGAAAASSSRLDLGNYSDEPLSGCDAESYLPPITEGVTLQAPDPLYRRHVSFDHGRTVSHAAQEIQPAYQPPMSPFDGAYSATQSVGEVGPGVLSSQPILGDSEAPGSAGLSRTSSADRPWMPSRLSNSSQLPPYGFSGNVQLPSNGLGDARQVAASGFSNQRQLPASNGLPSASLPPASGLSSERQLPPSGAFSNPQLPVSNGLPSASLPPANGLSSERQLPASGASSSPQLPVSNGLSGARQLPPSGLSSERQLPPNGLSSNRQLSPFELSSTTQLPPSGVPMARQSSAGLRQGLGRPSPARSMGRQYSSDKQLRPDGGADGRFLSDRQLGRLSDTPILEPSAGSRRFSRQKSGK